MACNMYENELPAGLVNLACRFYTAECPDEDDYVVGRATAITETHVILELPEYGCREAVMTLGNIKRGWMRSVHNHVKVGREDVYQVLAVDARRGHVDVGKKSVTAEDAAAAMDRYKRALSVNTLMRTVVVEQPSVTLEHLYSHLVWPLATEERDTLAALHAVARGEPLLNTLDLQAQVKAVVCHVVAVRLAVEVVCVHADVEVMCFAPGGIDAIKEALHAAASAWGGDERNAGVSVRLKAMPVYSFEVHTMDVPAARAVIQSAVEACSATIDAHGGVCRVVVPARVGEEKVEEAPADAADAAVFYIGCPFFGELSYGIKLPNNACESYARWWAARAAAK
jgi:translation initiation factor 2 subunit 1